MTSRLSAIIFATLLVCQSAYAADSEELLPADTIETMTTELQDELKTLPPATNELSRQIDSVLGSVTPTLQFASDALKKQEFSTVVDSLGLAKGTLSVALGKLPDVSVVADKDLASSLEGKGLEKFDVENVRALMDNMAITEKAALPEMAGLLDRVNQSGMDLAELNHSLERIGSSAENVTRNISFDFSNLANFSQSLQSIINNPGNIDAISREIGIAVASLGGNLKQAASAVAYGIAAGVDVNLEAAAQGAGYGSFAAAVDAYNAANGTSYSVDQAKSALGAN